MRRTSVYMLLLAALALALSACGGSQPQPAAKPSAPAPAQPQAAAPAPAAPAPAAPAAPAKPKLERTDLNIGLSVAAVAFLPVYIAEEKGYFKDEGLNVKVVMFKGGTENLQALVGGATQIAAGAGTESVQAVEANRAVKAFWELCGYTSNSWYAKPGIKSWKEAKNLKWAVSKTGSQSDVILRWVLKKEGIDPDKEAKILSSGAPAARYAALKSGAVDASVLVPPGNKMAEREGFNKLGTLSDYYDSWPNEALYTTQDFLQKNPETLKAFVRAINRGAKDAKADQKTSIEVIKKAIKLTDEDAKFGWDEYKNNFPATGEFGVKGWDFMMDIMVQSGEVKTRIPLDQIFDQTYVNYAKTLK